RFNTLDRVVLFVTTPLNGFMARLTGSVSDAWYRYVDLRHARRESVELRRQLTRLARERDRLEFLGEENKRLRQLLRLQDANPDVNLVTATVIGAGSALTARTLTLDVGALDGIPRGAPVLAGQGLVGVVHRVAWSSSEVLTVADPRLTVMAHVVRNRARGRVRGDGAPPGDALRLTDFLSGDDVRIGDRVATSGLGGVLPKDVPIGVIRAVHRPEGAARPVADVEPYVDFARLEHATIVINEPVPDILATPEPLLPRSLRTATVTATVTGSAVP
ncbi:MAG: rod shape-determining protein MreC, partial [Myxococcota bacterium]